MGKISPIKYAGMAQHRSKTIERTRNEQPMVSDRALVMQGHK